MSPDVRIAVGVIGLATSHPFSDAAALLGLRPSLRLLVADDDPAQIEEFTRAVPNAEPITRAELLDASPAAVIVTLPPPRVAATVAEVLDAGAVCYVNKPAAVTHAQLKHLGRAVDGRADQFFTSSSLRLAPGVKIDAEADAVLLARATIRHDVARWVGDRSWQDDPAVGGGLVGTMGLHGIELLGSALGADLRVEHVSTSTRLLAGLKSTDTATIAVRWANGTQGTIEVLGNAADASYDISLLTRDGELAVSLPADPDDPYGTRATMTALLAMTDGAPPPVSWPDSRGILRALADAVAMAHPTPAEPRSSSEAVLTS